MTEKQAIKKIIRTFSFYTFLFVSLIVVGCAQHSPESVAYENNNKSNVAVYASADYDVNNVCSDEDSGEL